MLAVKVIYWKRSMLFGQLLTPSSPFDQLAGRLHGETKMTKREVRKVLGWGGGELGAKLDRSRRSVGLFQFLPLMMLGYGNLELTEE
jgi:hypothetical protein